jgi:twinkle protein
MSLYVIPDEIDFSAYMHETVGGRKVRDVGDYLQEMLDEIGKPQAAAAGWALPWDKTRDTFRYHPGEVTLWAGSNGTGKSLLTGQIALDMVCRREPVVIASLEMLPRRTLNRMVQQWIGSDPASYHGIPKAENLLRGLIRDFKGQAEGLLKIYDQVGQISADEALAMARYCADKLGTKHLVLDSLMKCVRGTDDYNAQKDFVNALCSVGKDTGMSIHLVAHTKKLADEGKRPNKYDVSGSSAITDLVDNVMLFWRNKPKEAERRQGGQKLRDEPDAVLMCCKQRELGEEPEFGLWYHKDSQSYVEHPSAEPINWEERCT